MSLLSIVDTASAELNLKTPTTVIGNSDRNVKQLLGFANREGKMLSHRASLQELRTQATHTSLAQEDQGDIDTIAPGFRDFVPDTVWDRTEQWNLIENISSEDWQYLIARAVSPSITHLTIRGDRLLSYPDPTAGNSWAFEYWDERWVSLAGGGFATSFQADNDTSRINETIIEMGVIWRFLKAAGLDYAEEKRDYEVTLKNYMLVNHSRTVRLGGGRRRARRGDVQAVAAS